MKNNDFSCNYRNAKRKNHVKIIHREKAPSNKTLDIWVAGTSNQLLKKGS